MTLKKIEDGISKGEADLAQMESSFKALADLKDESDQCLATSQSELEQINLSLEVIGHLTYYLDENTFRFNRRTCTFRGKLFYRLVQQALMVDPAPVATLKGPAWPFLFGEDNLNLDPIDYDSHYHR